MQILLQQIEHDIQELLISTFSLLKSCQKCTVKPQHEMWLVKFIKSVFKYVATPAKKWLHFLLSTQRFSISSQSF
jgi:hypothetical protein